MSSYICGCTPKQFNNIEKVCLSSTNIKPNHFKFGLSTLHAWIKFFECLLHVSYRLPFKCWQVRSFETRKKQIQDEFRSEMGLLVDEVLQGRGTTNDGNTSRRFFKDAEKSAKITGVDLSLIKRFDTILRAIASGPNINTEEFEKYTIETARYFVELYPWFYMPSSVHKILIHGAQVIHHALLPIGQLSEEAQECRNKDFKYYKEHHTRKNSRLNTNQDLMNYLLVSSDPYISSLRILPKKNIQEYSNDVQSLLLFSE